MAQKVIVQLLDDIDQTPADETVRFALDGVNYEIDLTTANAAKLRDSLAQWTGHARRTGGRKSTGRGGSSGGSGRQDLNEMREWGRKNGFKVSDRGRVSRELQEAYDKANG
ncbi:Lsr2 protein [Barrientosiimonas humi]|uniref:Lsr2 protein n=2 Tax=Barrientosiimonas TaxID=1535207 RepID=A0A542X7Z8_9MICO|nr:MULTISPECIES: Lsr2 family protein [Barrientosiimonas]TQL31951.1 Lsr2 protein [Barrientosiimonas humi]BDZ56653.1 Lsr2 family protein [Barrientosiimonas endolithica]CAG7571791.1 Nucleoid-associated protein Lsr2 [Barrientosiimonas humi]